MPPRRQTVNPINMQSIDPEMQAYLGMPQSLAGAQVQVTGDPSIVAKTNRNVPIIYNDAQGRPIQQAQMLPGTTPVPATTTAQSAKSAQGKSDQDQVNYFLNQLNDEDKQAIRDIYQNIPEDQYTNPQAIQQAVAQAEKAQPANKKRFSRLKSWLRSAAPFIGTIGGAIAGGLIGGPAGIAPGAATGAAIAKGTEQMIPQPGSSGNMFRGYDATEGQFIQNEKFNPQQRQAISDLLTEGMVDFKQRGDFSGLQKLLSGVIGQNLGDKFNFEPIRQRTIKQFNEETLPGIFERFTSLGKGAQRTGAFQGMLARGASDLGEGLAELEQKYNLQRMPLDLKKQALLQSLLGQQQNYDNTRRSTGIDAVRAGLVSPYESAYKPGMPAQPGIFQQAIPSVLKNAGEIGKQYIQNKFKGENSCATGNCK